MMRKLLSLGAGLAVTTYATEDAAQTGACILNGAQAVSDMTDAAIYTWAATQRCGKGESYVMKCEVDAAQAIESANKMVNVIVQTIDQCKAIKSENKACGFAAGHLTSSVAGLTAAAGQVIQQCPNDLAKEKGWESDDVKQLAGQSIADPAWPDGTPATCMVDVKDSIAQLFKATTAVSLAKENCKKGDAKCAYNALGVVDALSAMARYLMGAVGHCSKPGSKLPENFPIHCSEAITNMFKQSASFSAAATEMSVVCAPKEPEPTPAPTPAPVLQEVETVQEVQPVFPGGAPAGPADVVAKSYNIEGDGEPPSATQPAGTDVVSTEYNVVGDGAPPSDAPVSRLYGKELVQTARRSLSRLQKKGGVADNTLSTNTLNIGLTALLPLTAVVAFVGGMKLRQVKTPPKGYNQVYTGNDNI